MYTLKAGTFMVLWASQVPIKQVSYYVPYYVQLKQPCVSGAERKSDSELEVPKQ